MERDTLRNLVIASAIFFTIMLIGPRLLPTLPPPEAAQTTGEADASGEQPTPASQSPDGAASPTRPDTTISGAPSTQVPEAVGASLAVVEADHELTVAIGSEPLNGIDDKSPPSDFRMRLTLSNLGASVESATLTDHAESLGSEARYPLLAVIEHEDGTRYRSLAVDKISVDEVDLTLHDKKWNARAFGTNGETRYWTETEQGQQVEFYIDVTQNGREALRLTRRLTLPRQPRDSGRHDLKSELVIENLSDDRDHPVVVTYRGGLGIKQADTRMDDRVVDAGIRESGDTGVVGSRQAQSKVVKAQDVVPFYKAPAADTGQRPSWAATANKYFTCTLAPLAPNGKDEAENVTEVAAVNLDGETATDDDVTVQFVMDRATVAPGGKLTYPVDIYLGQKDAKAFRSVPAYKNRNYYYQITQGYGMCTFVWLVELMIVLLNGLHWIVRDYGMAIVILVVIVRILLHPITKKGQVNMVRMQQRMGAFAPQLEELKKKYANDKQRFQQESMKLYREHGVNPTTQMLTCLPMVIQLPIWVALWISLANNILMRHEPFLFTWVRDLTAPDALYTFVSPIVVPFFGWSLPSFNLLPILLSIAMYTQQKLQPKPKPNPSMSDQQRQQQEMMQKMMPLMSIMMLLIFYKAPSGLTLYIMTSSFFGTIEQWWIRKHIKEQEAAGTFDKPVKGKEEKPKHPKKPGKPSVFQRLQQMAENAQKQAQRPQKSKSRR
jgi:YidC/Oxa1 family membrane protein insertase